LKFRLEVFDTLPSTATLMAARAAEEAAPAGLAILARQQTAGRGTQGRAWQSPPGNLHLSVLLRPAAPARAASATCARSVGVRMASAVDSRPNASTRPS
jgi:BirA family biotin operon repressor/biotin-[acetyl-CoA-carboxylase] ligase